MLLTIVDLHNLGLVSGCGEHGALHGIFNADCQYCWLATIEAVVRDAAKTIWPQGEQKILARYGLIAKETGDV